jgi:hypothetical protein
MIRKQQPLNSILIQPDPAQPRMDTEYYRGEEGREYKRRPNQRQRGQVEVLDPQGRSPVTTSCANSGP